MPRDTGVVFQHGVGGRDVRVRLLTEDADKAAACGDRLAEWGLKRVRQWVVVPRPASAMAVNPFRPKEFVPELGAADFVPIRFGRDIIILDTVDKDDVLRFARWMCERHERAERARAGGMPSLKALADAGEIETISAG